MFTLVLCLLLLVPKTLASQVCSPSACLDGTSQSQLLAVDTDGSLSLTPGSYTPASPAYSQGNITSSEFTSLNSEGVFSASSSGVAYTIIDPILFTDAKFSGEKANPKAAWGSAYLPPGWFGLVQTGVALWGAVPDPAELPKGVAPVFTTVSSSACTPACASGGACTPTNSSNLEGTCTCLPGWSGQLCDACAPGFYGSNCVSCPANCTVCDDGLGGTGTCLGTSSAPQDCNCLHGSCGPKGECTCAAGWLTNTTDSNTQQCSICAQGFYEDANHNCLACPLGCTACTLQNPTDSGSTCTSCISGLSLSTGNQATCSARQGNCGSGRYWDSPSSSCRACSPACKTCTGPNTSDCLACAAPRANLNGTCVGYDATTGVCDSSTSGLQGVFVVNNDKSTCDSCPVGCATCTIPSFSTTSNFTSLSCQTCQEGYLMQDGQCVQQCGDGFFLPNGTAATNGMCQACDSKCPSCIGNSTTCTACAAPQVAWNGECLNACPDNSLPSNGTCLPCSTDCYSCSKPLSSTSCLSCPAFRPILQNGQCLPFCPMASYFDPPFASCKNCDNSCSACTGPSNDQCTLCPDGSKLSAGKCSIASCGKGGFALGLGLCLEDLMIQTANKEWAFVVIPIGLIGVVLMWWFFGRERQRTRNTTREFARKMNLLHIKDPILAFKLSKIFGLYRFRNQTGFSASMPTPPGSTPREAEEAKGSSFMDFEDDKENDRTSLRGMFLPSKGKSKKEEWGEEIQLDSPRGWSDKVDESKKGQGFSRSQQETDDHSRAAPPPYYASSPKGSTSTGTTTATQIDEARFVASSNHGPIPVLGYGESKGKVISPSDGTNVDNPSKALPPPPRPSIRTLASEPSLREARRHSATGVRFAGMEEAVSVGEQHISGGQTGNPRALWPNMPLSKVLEEATNPETGRIEHGWV